MVKQTKTFAVYKVAKTMKLVAHVDAKDEKEALKIAEKEHPNLKGKLVVRPF